MPIAAIDRKKNEVVRAQITLPSDVYANLIAFAGTKGHNNLGKIVEELAKSVPSVPKEYLELAKAS